MLKHSLFGVLGNRLLGGLPRQALRRVDLPKDEGPQAGTRGSGSAFLFSSASFLLDSFCSLFVARSTECVAGKG